VLHAAASIFAKFKCWFVCLTNKCFVFLAYMNIFSVFTMWYGIDWWKICTGKQAFVVITMLLASMLDTWISCLNCFRWHDLKYGRCRFFKNVILQQYMVSKKWVTVLHYYMSSKFWSCSLKWLFTVFSIIVQCTYLSTMTWNDVVEDIDLYINIDVNDRCILCSHTQDIERKARLLRRERELKKSFLLPQYQPRLTNSDCHLTSYQCGTVC